MLAGALLAAELGEPFAFDRLPWAAIEELFESVNELRVSVPFATLALLQRMQSDGRVEVRASVARTLPWFADLYPERVEQLLMPLACDVSTKVRTAVAESLADLIEASPNPAPIYTRWQKLPARAREVLEAARRSLSPPGT